MKSLLTLYCCFLAIACNPRSVSWEKSDEHSLLSSDSLRYDIFSAGKGYGFNILKNGKVYIHQPVIPCFDGLNAFPTLAAASQMAQQIIFRLNSPDFNALIQKSELQLLQPATNITSPASDEDAIFDFRNVPRNQTSDNSPKIISESLPFLKDAPLKAKWTVKENVPVGYRNGGFSFSIGSYVYLGSGECRDEILRDFWCFNTITETWTCLAEIPIGVFSGISFSIFDKGYVGLGTETGTSSGKFGKKMYCYEPEINTWRQIKDFPGTPRIDAAVFVIEDKAYAGTGFDGTNTNDFYVYDPKKGSWKRIADFAGGYVHASIGIGTGRQGFVIAGARAPADFRFVYEYIPIRDKWEERKPLPGYTRYFLAGGYIDSNLIVAGTGGANGGYKRFRDFFLYNITTDSWSNLPDYPVGKLGSTRACGATVDGRLFLGTGFNENSLNDWNVFEYYFTVRQDTGLYNETVCYPVLDGARWELYQECTTDDCYAGAAISTNQSLGDFCYRSNLTDTIRTVMFAKEGLEEKMFLFPRSHTIQTEKQPAGKPVSLRLFFTRQELESSLQSCRKKTGGIQTLRDVQVLQLNKSSLYTDPSNHSFKNGTYNLIHPRWFSYGSNSDVIVAEFSVSFLQSEFYLIISEK